MSLELEQIFVPRSRSIYGDSTVFFNLYTRTLELSRELLWFLLVFLWNKDNAVVRIDELIILNNLLVGDYHMMQYSPFGYDNCTSFNVSKHEVSFL